MNKSYLMSVGVFLVLSAGQVSCTKEKKTRDVYKPGEPIVRKTDGEKVGLSEYEKLSNSTMDLRDAINFRTSRLSIVAECRIGERDVQARFSFTGNSSPRVFQMVPKAVLAAPDLNEVVCNFEVVRSNEIGSDNTFVILNIKFVDKMVADVDLERESTERAKDLPILRPSEFKKIRVRYYNEGAASTQLICEDAIYKPLGFENVRPVADFDFANPESRVDEIKRLQTCRITINQNGRVTAFTRTFLLQIPAKPLNIAITLNGYDPKPESCTFNLDGFRTGHAIPLAEYVIDNPEMRRLLLVPKSAGRCTTIAVGLSKKGLYCEANSDVDAYISVSGGILVREDATSWVVQILPGQKLTLSVEYNLPTITSHSLRVKLNDAIRIQEIEDSGVIMDNHTLAQPDPFTLSKNCVVSTKGFRKYAKEAGCLR